MDTVLQHLSPQEMLARLRGALSHVKAVAGCVCLVFHPETFLIDSRARGLFTDIIAPCKDLSTGLSGSLPKSEA
jgi:hypothetical protein